MKPEYITRTAALLGEDAIGRLAASSVFIAGLGGVGGYVLEGLARSGVGEFFLCDADTVSESNLNRQILATVDTVGRSKVDVALERLHEINPDARASKYEVFLTPENVGEILREAHPDYVVDAIDTVSAKLELAVVCRELGIPLVSSMGTGNKLDPTRLTVTDISKTHTCPLARVMRRELKVRGIAHLDVLFSDEAPASATFDEHGRHAPASAVFVPACAGLVIASHVVKRLTKKEEK